MDSEDTKWNARYFKVKNPDMIMMFADTGK